MVVRGTTQGFSLGSRWEEGPPGGRQLTILGRPIPESVIRLWHRGAEPRPTKVRVNNEKRGSRITLDLIVWAIAI